MPSLDTAVGLHVGTGVSSADTALPGQGAHPMTLATAEEVLEREPPGDVTGEANPA